MIEVSTHTSDENESIAADVLRGAVAIGRELGEPPSRIYKLWQTGRLVGAWKNGRDLFASKRALRRAHHNRARSGK
jgi:hypothetical protein